MEGRLNRSRSGSRVLYVGVCVIDCLSIFDSGECRVQISTCITPRGTQAGAGAGQ